jgi:hypothetical protein
MSVLSESNPRVKPSQAKATPIIHDQSLSPLEFARAESISLGLVYKLWREGRGPAYFHIGKSRRISAAARQAWRANLEAAARKSDAA